MARTQYLPFVLFLALFLAVIALSYGDSKHHKVIIHVPYKVHTIHHHKSKKIPIYHYVEHKDHHHHHHHHHVEKHLEEEPHHHIEAEGEEQHEADWV